MRKSLVLQASAKTGVAAPYVVGPPPRLPEWESNPRACAYETPDLPLNYPAKGSGERIRTDDPLIMSQMGTTSPLPRNREVSSFRYPV